LFLEQIYNLELDAPTTLPLRKMGLAVVKLGMAPTTSFRGLVSHDFPERLGRLPPSDGLDLVLLACIEFQNLPVEESERAPLLVTRRVSWKREGDE